MVVLNHYGCNILLATTTFWRSGEFQANFCGDETNHQRLLHLFTLVFINPRSDTLFWVNVKLQDAFTDISPDISIKLKLLCAANSLG